MGEILGTPSEETPVICHRCALALKPGESEFYVVNIEAFADPTPPVLSDEDFQRDHRKEIARLLDQLRGLSEQELMDQVYRRLSLYLCGPCYRDWIENPTGQCDQSSAV